MYTNINILDAANLALTYAKVNGIEMSPLKLQKVLYYMQAWHATYFNGNPLYAGGVLPEAWVNGPVYREVYNAYKRAGSSDLTTSVEIDNIEKGFELNLSQLQLNNDQKQLITEVLAAYSIMPPEKLVGLTHMEKPWRQARNGYAQFDNCTEFITIESMVDYYRRRLKNNEDTN